MSTIQYPSHPYLDELEPYRATDLEQAAARAGIGVEQLIRLDSNENLWETLPQVAQALGGLASPAYYPDHQPLRRAVASYAGVEPEQVVLSNGADEMIDLLIRLLAEPGQAVIVCPPTFSMYAFFARVNRCRVLAIPRRPDFSVDAPAIEKTVVADEDGAAPRLLFLVSPGSPDGQALPQPVIQRLLALPIIVAVDETYIEFGGQSTAPLLASCPNLAIIRSFSKWAGLAGLRLGYGLLAPELAGGLERIKAPYNVNAAAAAAALATLADLESARAKVAHMIAERERLQAALAALGWIEPLPSQANFVLCRVKGRSAQAVIGALADRGILVRGLSDPEMADYVRISVGRPEHTDALVDALRRLE